MNSQAAFTTRKKSSGHNSGLPHNREIPIPTSGDKKTQEPIYSLTSASRTFVKLQSQIIPASPNVNNFPKKSEIIFQPQPTPHLHTPTNTTFQRSRAATLYNQTNNTSLGLKKLLRRGGIRYAIRRRGCGP
jgi:hypothetical protein